MNLQLIRHGFVLILIALLSGLLIPVLEIPRLGLSAHTIGILGGLLLIVIGAIWQQFHLSPRQQRLMSWSWLYSSYINWAGVFLGAALGTGRATPIASAGASSSTIAEGLVFSLLLSVAIASLLAVTLSIWGLRPGDRSRTS